MAANSDHRLKNIAAVPNGAYLAGGGRAFNKLRAQGVSNGYPDVLLDWPTYKYHGLRIEFKTPEGRVSEDQKKWGMALIEAGYCWVVCRSVDQAISLTTLYLGETL
jgi:hypothetical protein